MIRWLPIYCCLLVGDALASGLAVVAADAVMVPGAVQVRAEINADLDGPVHDALRAGVPLRFEIVVSAYQRRRLLPDTKVLDWQTRREISYHGLSQRYSLGQPGQALTSFASLPALLDQFGRIEQRISRPETALLPDYFVLDVRLDLDTLPAPMRLPVLLSPAWRQQRLHHSWTPTG